MARSGMAQIVSGLLRLFYRHKTTEKQAEDYLDQLLRAGEKESPAPKGLPVRYDRRFFFLNENSHASWTVFYMHGGGYQNDFSPFHWKFLKKVIEKTDAAVMAPAYRLIPFGTCRDAFDLIVPFYRQYCDSHPEKKIVLMGDSSGGGLALALAEHFAAEGIRQPDELILLSPWVDVSMENPEISSYTAKDPWLTVPWLKVCGRHWAGDYDLRDYRVSPALGDLSSLSNTTVFVGTRELLFPDITRCFDGLGDQGNELVIGPEMNHVFPLLPIPEAEDYCRKIFELIMR